MQMKGAKNSVDYIRNRRAALVDNTTTYFDLKFDVALVANNRYYLERLGLFLTDKIVTGVELFPALAGGVVGGYNLLIPLDYPQFTLTLVNSKQEILADNIPFAAFSTLGNVTKDKIFMFTGIDMRYSFIKYSGLALATPFPLIIPLMFKYHC